MELETFLIIGKGMLHGGEIVAGSNGQGLCSS